MLAIVRTRIIHGAAHHATGTTGRMIAAERTILPKLAASIALRVIAAVGAGIRRSTADLAAATASGVLPLVSTILFQFATGVALGMLAIVRTRIDPRTTDLATGLARGMITAIRAIGLLLQTLPAHRLLRAQAQRRQKQEATG